MGATQAHSQSTHMKNINAKTRASQRSIRRQTTQAYANKNHGPCVGLEDELMKGEAPPVQRRQALFFQQKNVATSSSSSDACLVAWTWFSGPLCLNLGLFLCFLMASSTSLGTRLPLNSISFNLGR
uniref:Uncharacterized protein n=1 Tax=Arundo donax TaxID=35708 RepID=A0A0A8Z6V7_ARUDO